MTRTFTSQGSAEPFPELQSWRIAHDLRLAEQKAEFDAQWDKLLADNPKFAAALPELDEIAGFYAMYVGLPA
jgi:hypothetical protein